MYNEYMELLPVRPFQETPHQGMCAPATLKMLLTYWNLPGQELPDVELATECGTDTILGTTNQQFIAAAHARGLQTVAQDHATLEDIEVWLRKGVPVVVDWFSPGRKDEHEGMMPDGHYSIVVGIDTEHIYLQDPELGGMRTLPTREFERVWFDFTGTTITQETLVIRWMCAAYTQPQ